MNRNTILAAMLLWLAATTVGATPLTPDTDYYIWLNIYEKLLGSNEAGSGPALSAYGTTTDPQTYIFTAEDSGHEGYVLLRQKSSGRYLAASASSTYSMTLETTRATDDRYLWAADEGTYTYLRNRKSGKYVGVDGANKGKAYVATYYDKPRGSHAQLSIIPAVGDSWDAARAAYTSAEYTNAQGAREIDYCLLRDCEIDRSDAIDIHVTANEQPIQGTTTINLGSEHTWLILDNVRPSQATSYLKHVTINGKKAANGSNCRIAIFLQGCAIIPLPNDIMTCKGTDGDFSLKAGNSTTLGSRNNTMTSFILHRGYMATLASGTKGSGHSRVYVADHADLEINLPQALAKRVSSVNIKPWQYLSKKGWASTGGATQATAMQATWFWSWSAGYNSSADLEFVPCRQHRYWPSASEVNSKTASASLSLNEPEHSEQHTSSICSCGGTIDAWTAYGYSADFQAGGGRIGSPQPTDLSYLTQFCKYVDENNNQSRCDFTVTHAYWDIGGRTESGYADWFVNQCKSIWNNTGRPVWLTEMEIGASWGTPAKNYEEYRKYLQVLLQRMEECDWIERYAIYATDYWTSYMYYEANASKGLTPAGQVYRDHRSTFAYHADYTKTPAWWMPAAKTPALVAKQNASSGKLSFQVSNPNTDLTDKLVIQRLVAGDTWQTVYELTDRALLDSEKFTIQDVDAQGANIEVDQFRVAVTTTAGRTVYSSTTDSGYIQNPRIEADSKTSIEGWTCLREASNGNTKGTGDTYLEVWNANAAAINFDYYQELTELENGVYQLSAVVFNTADGVEGAKVNGAVGLYAASAGQFYFAPVLADAAEDATAPITSSTTDISSLPRTVIDTILVTDGHLRIGIRNLGTMTARWAGADNFLLRRVADLKDVDLDYAYARNAFALYDLMPDGDATRFIINPDCNNQSGYGWTTKNVDYKADAESYDALATNAYWNIWKSGAYESSMTQQIVGLPEGTYTFSAILRGQNTATMTLQATAAGTSASATEPTATAQQTFIGHGASSAATDPYQQGWQRVTTPAFEVRRGQVVTLSLDVACSATAWWSADHFALRLENIPEVLAGIEERSSMRTERPLLFYDLTGRPYSTPSKPGLYVVKGKRVLIR